MSQKPSVYFDQVLSLLSDLGFHTCLLFAWRSWPSMSATQTLTPARALEVTRAKSLQLCPALCNPMDCSPPGSSVHGILQARIVEWDAMIFSRGPSQPKDQTCVASISCIGRQVLRETG